MLRKLFVGGFVALVVGCGGNSRVEEGKGTPLEPAGSGGSAAGTGGAGVGGSAAGTGGAGVGGSAAGTGGAGAGGSAAGTGGAGVGGSAAGTGGAGAGGSAAGTSGSAGTGGGPPHGTPTGRPEAIACPPTDISGFITLDGGVPACSVDSDCSASGSALAYCRDGQCSPDECLTDGDCPDGTACACASQFRGNAFHVNGCITTGCRVDADCGANGVCSESISPSPCGGIGGYQCHGPDDECNVNADCAASTPTCAYQPTRGHWACQAALVCNG